MNYEEVADKIARSHALIQDTPTDRLDYIQKTAAIKQVILGCVNYLDQLNYDPNIMEYTEKVLSSIHEAVCVSAIPLRTVAIYSIQGHFWTLNATSNTRPTTVSVTAPVR